MLQLPNPIGDEKADKIITEFVNYRLLEIMEDIILDEVVWGMAQRGELDQSASTKSFDELVDLKELMLDDEFAAAVSMSYLPDNYPLEKANKKFFGLYKVDNSATSLNEAGKMYSDFEEALIYYRSHGQEIDDGVSEDEKRFIDLTDFVFIGRKTKGK